MIRGCLSQLITWGLILAVALWVLRHPESVAALISGAVGLVVSGADAIGGLVNALTPTLNNLF
uniref:PSQ10.4c n=1 Tax=Nocardiopsis sp. 90127 TaxID=373213 RepID=Q27I84_9ACTN|nr:hypothetical protein [Nocardiopsis sp. 90127]ABD48727.1 pSQ10.4c [Nocardiopsis sp. 90127]